MVIEVLSGAWRPSWTSTNARDLAKDYAVDLGGRPSTAEWALLSRAAGLQVMAEMQEAEMAEGGQINVDVYAKLTNSLVSVLRTIGLAKRPRDVSPREEPLEGHAQTITELAEEEGQ